MLWPNGSAIQPGMTYGFGPRPGVGAFPFHYGADLIGFNVARAIAAGKVTFAGWLNGAAGNTVIVDHGHGVTSLQMHLATVDVARSAVVKLAQRIGTVGRTGNATGVCDHLEIRVHGKSVDPLPYIRARLTTGAPASVPTSTEGDDTMAVAQILHNSTTGDVFAVTARPRIKHLGSMTDVNDAAEAFGAMKSLDDREFRIALIVLGIPYSQARKGADWTAG